MPRKKQKTTLSDRQILDLLDSDDDDEVDLEELTGGDDGGWKQNVEETVDDIHCGDTLYDSEEDESEEVVSGDCDVVNERSRNRPVLNNRLVRSIDSSLDPENYAVFELPEELKECSAVLQKKSRNTPEKIITWRNQPVSRVGRQGRENLLRSEGGVKGMATQANTPKKCFQLFFSPEMISLCTDYTNIIIDKRLTELANKSTEYAAYLKPVDEIELTAYIGLCMLRGLYKQNHWTVKRIWEDKIGHQIFRATMSYNRFSFLSSLFCMDNPDTRRERFKTDRFSAAQEIFEMFNDNCSIAVELSLIHI